MNLSSVSDLVGLLEQEHQDRLDKERAEKKAKEALDRRLVDIRKWLSELATELVPAMAKSPFLFYSLNSAQVTAHGDSPVLRINSSSIDDPTSVYMIFEQREKGIEHRMTYGKDRGTTQLGSPVSLPDHSRESLRSVVLSSLKAYLDSKTYPREHRLLG